MDDFFYCRKNTHIQVQTQTYCKAQIYSDTHTVEKVLPLPSLPCIPSPWIFYTIAFIQLLSQQIVDFVEIVEIVEADKVIGASC